MSELVQIPYDNVKAAQLENGWKIQVYTPDLAPDHVTEIATKNKTTGWFVLRANNSLSAEDIPVDDAPIEHGEKTPSQRLRAVLYVRWQQNGAKGNPDDYYRREMERLINHVKDSLD